MLLQALKKSNGKVKNLHNSSGNTGYQPLKRQIAKTLFSIFEKPAPTACVVGEENL